MKKRILLILLLIVSMTLSLTSCDAVHNSIATLPCLFGTHDWYDWKIETPANNCEDRIFSRNCRDCDKVETKKGSHEYTENYLADEESHWYGCKHCGYRKENEKHSLTNDTCNLCEYTNKPTEGIIYGISTDGTYAYVLDYEGTDSCVVVRSEYEGVPVTTLCKEAFYKCEQITNIVLPDSITYIDESAFACCYNLTSIVIGRNVNFIDADAFWGCINLNGIFISDISAWCNITFSPSKSKYIVNYIDGVTYGSSTSRAHLYLNYKFLAEAIIPDDVTYIKNEEAFSRRKCLTKVIIGNGITSIDENTFYNCANLVSVNIGNNVTSIGKDAFSYCDSLTNVNISDSVTSIGDGAFLDCYNLKSITIPDSVTSIGNCAFFECEKLSSVTIGNGVTSIGDSAFFRCHALTNLVIGDSVNSIGEDAFYACSSLTSITIPDSVMTIGKTAFSNCYSLASVKIGRSVASIGECAFIWCTSLNSISVDKNNPYYMSIDGNLYTKDGAVLIQYAIAKENTSFKIPDSVTTIENHAFFRCSTLTNLVIGDSVNSIGEDAFTDCSNLTSITISDSVTTIDDYAFYRCYRLKDVYYTGTKQEWAKISIGSYNDYITNATIHYNYVP